MVAIGPIYLNRWLRYIDSMGFYRREIVKAIGIRRYIIEFNSIIIILLSFLEIKNHARNKKSTAYRELDYLLVENGKAWALVPLLLKSGPAAEQSRSRSPMSASGAWVGGLLSVYGAVSGSPVNGPELWAGNFAAPLTCSSREMIV